MKLGTAVKKFTGKAIFLGKKYAPEILLGAGIVGGGVTAYLAYKAAPKVEEVLDQVEEAEAEGVEVPKSVIVIDVAKKMAPAIATGVASFACLVGSYKIQANRIASVTGALGVAVREIKLIKDKYVEKYGEEKAKEFFKRTKKEKVVRKTKDGKVEEVIEEVAIPNTYHDGALFNRDSDQYASDDPEYNEVFVQGVISELEARAFVSHTGVIELNEVLDAFGFDPVFRGATFGWITTSSTLGLDYEIINVYNKDKAVNEPMIYIKWTTPVAIYDKKSYDKTYYSI